jgi:DNA polymerase-1
MIEIKNRFPNSKMLLQIHDELIFEIDSRDEAYEYQQIMQNVFKLEVPLKVGISFGKRWGELKY